MPNTFFRRDGETTRLAVIFPGVGYTAQGPLLWYTRLVLQQWGADVLAVEYEYGRRPEFATCGVEQSVWLASDVGAACGVASRQRRYKQVALAGKSLGTLALGNLIADSMMTMATAIWLTPLIKRPELREQILAWHGRSLFVIGTADPQYDATLWNDLIQKTGGQSLVVEGADHGMDVPGDVERSLAALNRVLQAERMFLEHVGRTGDSP